MSAKRKSSAVDRFDRAYYERYYLDPQTRVTSLAEARSLVRFVLAYLEFLGLDPRRIIDFGAGTGLWRDALYDLIPDFEESGRHYVGVEVSEASCQRYGWTQGSVVSFTPKGTFDLVVCSGVLQYVGDADVGRAIANLARCCRGAVYIQLLTKQDWDEVADRRRTDGDVHIRPGAFYRKYLWRSFHAIGGGLFVPKETQLPLWELEYLG